MKQHPLCTLLLIGISLSASADPQDDRLAYIEYVKSRGIFELVEVSDNVARLIVKPVFHDSDFRSKEYVAKVVFDYMTNLPARYVVVQIIDGGTGKQIGIITPAGLKLF